ncbi:spore germination protein [Dethiothermospora halolimnae]|uniref:spore germination protein n=1 Tax=Dethiothermospora halolimnae TaxID=3114390 RepID=UPI003CCC3B32
MIRDLDNIEVKVLFKKIVRIINYLKYKSENHRDGLKKENKYDKEIPKTLKEMKLKLSQKFEDCSDIVVRTVKIDDDTKVLLVYIDGLSNHEIINKNILNPLMTQFKEKYNINQKDKLTFINEEILHTAEVEYIYDFNNVLNSIVEGKTILYIDGYSTVLKIGAKGWESRGIEEPQTESVVRGPREGFTETLRSNTALLRRIIKDPNFKIESMVLGEKTRTEVSICYIKGLARKDIIGEVKKRLNKIKIDGILESGYIEEFIEDNPLSPFPQIGNSERPDKVAGKILEGRVAIICDGTPFVLTVPRLFIEALQTSEDYYSKPHFVTMIRIFRVIALLITITLPAFYVAFISYHPQSIPFKLLMSMAKSREGIPFSPFVEALVMLTAFELLREAGVRMPKPVGQAVSIVGALILGEAAVKAGIASNLMIIITALTAICTFIVPSLGGVIPLLRIFLLIGANLLGYMGIFLVAIIITTHLFQLKSFGVLYMYPMVTLDPRSYKDSFIRLPIWMMFTRPRPLAWENSNDGKYRMKLRNKRKED